LSNNRPILPIFCWTRTGGRDEGIASSRGKGREKMDNRKAVIVILIALAMLFPATLLVASDNASAAPAGWSTTVVDASHWSMTKYSTVKVDTAGKVHIAFVSESRLYYATNKTGAWIMTELDALSTYQKYYPSMAINATSNIVFISYAVYVVPGGIYNIRLAVIPAVGAASIETVYNTATNGAYSAIGLDALGNAHVFFSDESTSDLYEKNRSWAGVWSAPVVIQTLSSDVDNTNVIITPAGETYIVYQGNFHDIDYGIRSSPTSAFTWGKVVTIGNSRGVDQLGAISLTLDSAKNMHISYDDNNLGMIVYANNIGVSPGNDWSTFVTVAPDNVGNEYCKESSVVIFNGVPNVVYKKDYSLHMDPYNSIAESFSAGSLIEAGVSGASYGGANSATVSSSGHVFIAYTGYDNPDSLAGPYAIRLDANIILPGVPQNLTGVPANKQVKLTWGAASNNSGPDILYYNIYRATTAGTEIFVNHTTGPVLSFIDTDRLANLTPYYYKEGPKSSEITSTPKAIPLEPGNLAISNPENAKVHLSWTASETYGAPEISAYYIYRSTVAGDEAYLNKTISGTVLSYDDLAATNGQQYFYKVGAVNINGFGPNSTEVTITPYWTPSAPGFTAAAGNSQVVFTWTEPTDKGGYTTVNNYTLYSGTYPALTLLANVSGTAVTYTMNGLTNGQAYYFAIGAVNAKGEGLKSFANATPSATPQPPSVPINPVATGGSGYIKLVWSTPLSAGTQSITDYKIYRGDSSTPIAYYGHTGSASTSYNDSGLMNGMTYYYAVVAVNSIGDSSQSAAANASTSSTPPAGAPDSISDVVVSSNDNSVDVSWTAPFSGNSPITHYYVYRAETNETSKAVRIANLSGSVLSFQDTTAVNGKTYYYWVVTSNNIGASEAAASQSVVPAAKSGSSSLPIIIVVVVVIVVVLLVLFLFMRKKKATPAAPPAGMPPYQQPVQQQYQQLPAAVTGMCPQCGIPVGSDFAVCPNCGNNLR
jgi:fibronectin type 3 domain-containing protein